MSQPIPWSNEAEQSVIGSLLLDCAAIDRIPELRPEHFYASAHSRLFAAIQALVAGHKPVDVITVFERIRATGDEEEVGGGMSYINALAASVPSASNVARYAEIVRDHARARQLVKVGHSAMEAANDQTRAIEERIEQVSTEVMALLESEAQQESVALGDLVAQHTEVIEARSNGDLRVIPTGLFDLDEMLCGGHEPGGLVIIGARPSMGKTAFALSVAMHISGALSVGFLSLEMSCGQLADRGIALLGRISMKDVKRPPSGAAADVFWGRMVDATEQAASKRLYVDDQAALTIAQVRAKARAMKRKHGIGVLIIDYLQLMSGTDPKQNRAYQLEEITRGLKSLAKELGIVVIALAQVLRRVDGRPDGLPSLSDLKDSGSIEQDADVVLFLHRPIHANPKLSDEFKHYAVGFLAKNRQGETGLLNLSYIAHETRFANWSGPAPSSMDNSDKGRRGGFN